jgi:hypothetical protein
MEILQYLKSSLSFVYMTWENFDLSWHLRACAMPSNVMQLPQTGKESRSAEMWLSIGLGTSSCFFEMPCFHHIDTRKEPTKGG